MLFQTLIDKPGVCIQHCLSLNYIIVYDVYMINKKYFVIIKDKQVEPFLPLNETGKQTNKQKQLQLSP